MKVLDINEVQQVSGGCFFFGELMFGMAGGLVSGVGLAVTAVVDLITLPFNMMTYTYSYSYNFDTNSIAICDTEVVTTTVL